MIRDGVMEIFLCEILLVRVQYARVMHYTRAGNTKRAHKNTRARIIRCVDVMRSIHTTPRETPESFSQSIWYPMCDQRSCAREAFQSEPGVVLFRRLVRSCAYNPTPVTLARLYEVSSRDGLRLREPRYVLELVRNAFLAKHKEQHVGERTKTVCVCSETCKTPAS